MADGLSSAYSAPQLMELSEAKTLGVFDDHETGVGHINADFYHCCCDQQVNVTCLETIHNLRFLICFKATMD